MRDREGDPTLLAHAFLEKFCKNQGRSFQGFSADALQAIEAYSWPGNAREMENFIKRAVIMADGPQVTQQDLGLNLTDIEAAPINLRQVREEAERKALVRALGRVGGNMLQAAELLGISRPTLYDLLNRHGIK